MTENKTVYNTIKAEQLLEEGRLYYNGIYGGREDRHIRKKIIEVR